jgi:hypothetical protein
MVTTEGGGARGGSIIGPMEDFGPIRAEPLPEENFIA